MAPLRQTAQRGLGRLASVSARRDPVLDGVGGPPQEVLDGEGRALFLQTSEEGFLGACGEEWWRRLCASAGHILAGVGPVLGGERPANVLQTRGSKLQTRLQHDEGFLCAWWRCLCALAGHVLARVLRVWLCTENGSFLDQLFDQRRELVKQDNSGLVNERGLEV